MTITNLHQQPSDADLLREHRHDVNLLVSELTIQINKLEYERRKLVLFANALDKQLPDEQLQFDLGDTE